MERRVAALHGASGRGRQRAMKLKLHDERKEIARVGDVGRHVILGPGVEIRLGPWTRWRDALVLQPQIPPALVVLVRRNFA